ncbi:hypothetical protein LXA43DRAFT_13526 [Ganoderma leucocontextum]|nr:hypothetical protein LXA43DRAFT_13526 [Ganoderma leucocontextum]
MKKTRSFRSQAFKIAAIVGLVGTLICFIVVAVGGAFPTYKHGTSIFVPHAEETWQVGELHTVQWILNSVKTVNDKGENITARLILSYGGDSNSHMPLGELTDWFNITDMLANVIVPSVPTRDDYALYMFSRDEPDVSSWSGSITIFNPNDVDGQDEPPSSIVVTTAPPVSVTKSLASTFSESPSTTHSTHPSLPSVSLTSGLSLSLPLLSATSAASPSATMDDSPASATVSTSGATSSSIGPLGPTSTAISSSPAADPTTAPITTQAATVQSIPAASTTPIRIRRATNFRRDQRPVH